MRQQAAKLVTLSLGCALLSACNSVHYYGQAVSGQLRLLRQRQPITELLQDQQLPSQLQQRLQLVQQVREFAATELKLPVNQQFDSYVDLQREFVVWNVAAVEEFSLAPKQWCYPIAGCVGYRGYFSEADAQRYAEQLQQDGYDTYVGGVTAYSTLGWFDDPVLSSMLRRDDLQLAAVLIHELAHGLLYVPGDMDFNESFATTVEQEGLRRWLLRVADPLQRAQLQAQAERFQQRQQQFVALVQNTVTQLEDLYQQPLPPTEMRQRKQQQIVALQLDYQRLKQQWQGYNGYDRFFAGSLNNAQLSTVQTYHRWVPQMQQLWRQSQGDVEVFYKALKQLAALPAQERQSRLLEVGLP